MKIGIDNLIERSPYWLSGEGNLPELVLSSRVRLARNLEAYPFPRRCSKEDKLKIKEEISSAVRQLRLMKDAILLDISSLSELDKKFLIERHLVSLDLARNGEGGGVLVTPDEVLSIAINEEDHLRIQAITPGLSLDDALERAVTLDEEMGKLLDYAYSKRFGFLTSCPTNTGTGLRFSALLHLPGIVYTKQVDEFLNTLKKVRITVRGLYGEGSKVLGNIFQVSSAISLGISEEETLKSFMEVVNLTVEFEKKARSLLMEKMRSVMEDRIYRSYALLENAKLLSFDETAEYTSAVRLGVGIGVFLDMKVKTLNELLLFSQPAHIQKIFGKSMSSTERDEKRASYARTKLKTG